MAAEAYLGFSKARIEVELNDEKVALSQVVYIRPATSRSGDLIKRLNQMSISAKFGNYSADNLLKQLGQLGVKTEKIKWLGTRQTILVEKTNDEEYRAIANQAETALIEQLKVLFPQVEVEATSQMKKRRRLVGFDNVRVKPLQLNKTEPLTGINKRMSIWIELIKNDRVVDEVPLWFKVKVFDDVLTAQENIRAETRVDLSMVEKRRVEVTNKRNGYFTSLPKESLWVVKNLKRGEVLTQKTIKPEPWVKRNKPVIVEYSNRNISIQVKGKALNHGYENDRVLVDIKESSRPVSTRVIATNKVKVIENDA